MPKPLGTDSSIARAKAQIRNLSLLDVGITADLSADSPFKSLGYKPDAGKAYLEFEILNTIPEFLGPVELGNYVGVMPDTLAASHASLQHQQFNLGHKLKAYSAGEPGDEGYIARDHIIGAIVATDYPRKPIGGWEQGKSYPVKAMAVIFKLADGVSKVLGEHLTEKKPQSVSIEMTTNLGNMGVHRRSTGETWPLIDLPENVVKAAIKMPKDSNMPIVGKLDGEQLLVVYGMGEPIQLKGVGMTPTPAERAARIVGVSAQTNVLERDEDTLISISASAVEMALVGQEVTFRSGRHGTIDRVFKEGNAMAPNLGFTLAASQESPVVRIKLNDREWVLCTLAELRDLA